MMHVHTNAHSYTYTGCPPYTHLKPRRVRMSGFKTNLALEHKVSEEVGHCMLPYRRGQVLELDKA